MISFWLKVSRPGLWFATLWLYLMPTSGLEIWDSMNFWLGLAYVTFPLNFMVYGWNDINDFEIDQINPRKDSFWFGAKGSQQQLAALWKPIVLVQIICLPVFIWIIGLKMVYLYLGLLFINFLYNHPRYGLSSRPPLEILCQIGYLLVVPFSVWLNEVAALPWQTYFYLLLFAFQSHLMGEVMDIEPDRKSGRKTTATVIGMRKTKLLIILIVALEVCLLFVVFKEYIFGGILALSLLWLILDLLFIFKTKTYSLSQMKLFGLLSNIAALVTMAYVWYSGCLLSV
ncbi:MAG: 4-hydroxybenzoate polyprenyltransferase [Saprospiraceae bacterium]|jgi:4-hydroxybenzoate polyprenyltransferase